MKAASTVCYQIKNQSKRETITMVTIEHMLPPIRADTAQEHGEPQLLKKRLKTENLDTRRNNGTRIIFGGCSNEN